MDEVFIDVVAGVQIDAPAKPGRVSSADNSSAMALLTLMESCRVTKPPQKQSQHTHDDELKVGKSAGNVVLLSARLIVTCPSSSGCRITSSVFRLNSGSSSKNRIPL